MAYSQKSINAYKKKRYYTVGVALPIECKQTVQDAAAARGVSVAKLFAQIVGRELGVDLALDGSFPGAKPKGDADHPETR